MVAKKFLFVCRDRGTGKLFVSCHVCDFEDIPYFKRHLVSCGFDVVDVLCFDVDFSKYEY